MARDPGLWLRARDKVWMTTLNGKQVKLSADKGEARKMLHKLLAADETPRLSSGVSCRRLLDTYLTRTGELKSAGRLKLMTRYFKRFCETFGHRKAEVLKPYEVSDWLGKQELSDSTKALIVSMLRAGFNFGVREGYLPASPMKGVRKGKFARRERMLTAAELDAVVAESCHADFLTVLRITGMRPFSECAVLTAGHLDREKKRAVLVRHKTAEKTGKPRVIYFPPAAWEIVSKLAEARPEGLLFRNSRGGRLTCDAVNKHLREVCGRAGVERFPVYAIRHHLASSALGRGVPVDVLAAVIGNSPKTLRDHYSHMEADAMADVLARAAQQAAG